MRVQIEPGKASGTVCPPPSKSLLHRMLICAALADGESVLRNFSVSEDLAATIDCLRAMGAQIRQEGNSCCVRGFAKTTDKKNSALPILPCRESGSTLRLLLPLSLLRDSGIRHSGINHSGIDLDGISGGIFTGSKRLLERGVGVYESLLPPRGITFSEDDHALTVQGELTCGDYRIPGNVSSQFVSGMLLALPFLPGDSTVTVLPPSESRPYIALTTSVLQSFGITIESPEELCFRIRGGQKAHPANVRAEGDWSQAAFFLALNFLGGTVSVSGLNENSLQGDRICQTLLEEVANKTPEADLSECPDLSPILFALAAAHSGAHFTGTRRLAFKESNRALAMAQELAKFGISVRVTENDAAILPGRLHRPETDLDGHGDHRIVMALAILATVTGGTITGAEAVRKSYPNFFRDLSALGIRLRTTGEA